MTGIVFSIYMVLLTLINDKENREQRFSWASSRITICLILSVSVDTLIVFCAVKYLFGAP